MRDNVEDEEDRNDEDYVPTKDEPDEDVVMLVEEQVVPLNSLQIQNVDTAFQRLFGYPWGTDFQFSSSPTRQQKVLIQCLGKSKAAAICQTQSVKKKRMTVHRKEQSYKHTTKTTATSAAARKPSETTRTETKESKKKPPPSGSGGVDAVLESLASGNQKVSTVAKTSADWDSFKQDSGLGNKLEEAADVGYLKRQDFLNRVDGRQFELERQDRERERSKRGK